MIANKICKIKQIINNSELKINFTINTTFGIIDFKINPKRCISGFRRRLELIEQSVMEMDGIGVDTLCEIRSHDGLVGKWRTRRRWAPVAVSNLLGFLRIGKKIEKIKKIEKVRV